MTINKPAIVYIALGSNHVHRQVILSILTLYYFVQEKEEFEKIKLIVYTDNKEIFEENLNGINIYYEILTQEKIKEYVGDFNFILRSKVCIIKDYFQKYKSNVLFLDADTYFLNSPFELINKISKNTTIFHEKEFDLIEGSEPYGKTLKFGFFPHEFLSCVIKKNNEKLQKEEIEICSNVEMWNSGVLGISLSNLPILDDVLKLTDQLSKKSSYYTAEQFAFSYNFFKKTRIIQAKEFIYHYYELKEIYDFHINKFLERNKGETIDCKAANAVQLTEQQDELSIPKKTEIEKFKRKIKKLRKYNKTKIFFRVYHLRFQLVNKLRYLQGNLKIRF